jgi:hypothetical protein
VLGAGRKYKKAKELQQAGKKMKIINEDGLLDLIRSSSKNSSTSSTAPAVSALSSKVSGSAPSTLGQDLTIQQTSLTTSALSSAQPTQKNTELWTDKYRFVHRNCQAEALTIRPGRKIQAKLLAAKVLRIN